MARLPAEIVEEICVHLRPWKRCEADVRSEVDKRITLLVGIAANVDQWPRGADVREAVRDAREALDRLRKALGSKSLKPFVAAGSLSNAKRASDAEHAGAIFVDDRYFDRLDAALAMKESIKAPDPRSDPVKWLCAETADALIHELSRKPATGSADSPLHAIASLLYEAIMGQPDQDLKRAIDSVIASWRGLNCMPGRGRPARKTPKS
jgi:hypothetical protein